MEQRRRKSGPMRGGFSRYIRAGPGEFSFFVGIFSLFRKLIM